MKEHLTATTTNRKQPLAAQNRRMAMYIVASDDGVVIVKDETLNDANRTAGDYIEKLINVDQTTDKTIYIAKVERIYSLKVSDPTAEERDWKND